MRTYIDAYIEERMERGNFMPNPYTPGAGTQPNFLAGRDDVIKQVTNYIDEVISGEMARHCIFYGVRGVGKKVNSNQLYKYFLSNITLITIPFLLPLTGMAF